MLTTLQLLEAVNKIQEHGVRIDEMVVMAPVGTMALLTHQEYENNTGRNWLCNPSVPARFNGVLVVEDQTIERVIVRSLISEQRGVIDG